MTVDRLLSDVIQIDDLRGSGWRAQRDSRWDFEAHHQNLQWLIRIVGNRMLHARSNVGKIIGVHGMLVISVLQKPGPVHHKINLFLTIVSRVLTTAVGVERGFPEPSYAPEYTVLVRALAEDWFVVAGGGCQTRVGVLQVRNLPVQPCGVYFSLLCKYRQTGQQQQQERWQTQFRGSGGRVIHGRSWYTTQFA